MQPIVIAAGGTGGHFFPAEALAAELIARGHRIVLMTDARSGSRSSSVFAGHENYVISGSGIAGRGAWRGIKAIAAMTAGVFQARAILKRLDAGAVVGFGGYPCVAPILATRLLSHRPAVILHEQNAVLGRANRFLAGQADVLALGFAGTTRIPRKATTPAGPATPADTLVKITGNPVRPQIAALAASTYEAPTGQIRLLILGGSLGARIFSDVVPAALCLLPDATRQRLHVVQQTRPEDQERVRAAYAEAAIQADLCPFFPDVAARLEAAHLVIARAGASTVAELAVAGRPAILVPLPGAIDDHQSANARALAEAGAAWPVPQSSFTAASLADRLAGLLTNPTALSKAAAAARTQARPDAAARLADQVEASMAQKAGAHR